MMLLKTNAFLDFFVQRKLLFQLSFAQLAQNATKESPLTATVLSTIQQKVNMSASSVLLEETALLLGLVMSIQFLAQEALSVAMGMLQKIVPLEAMDLLYQQAHKVRNIVMSALMENTAQVEIIIYLARMMAKSVQSDLLQTVQILVLWDISANQAKRNFAQAESIQTQAAQLVLTVLLGITVPVMVPQMIARKVIFARVAQIPCGQTIFVQLEKSA